MYRVTVITDGGEYPLHEPNDDTGELMLLDPVLTQEVGKNGSFQFCITVMHPNRDKITALKSEVRVYDDGEMIFCGRPIGDEKDFYNTGAVDCEGEQAYMIDSIQRPFRYTGSGADFLRQLLEIHNSQVEEWKRMEPGNITVPDMTVDIQRDEAECKSTLSVIIAHLTDINGGYLHFRHVNGKRYVDYVNDYGGINSQVIRFGENMLDMTQYTKPASIITALVPYGAEIENSDPEAEVKRVDITSVNNGLDYISSQDAVNAYGKIWGSHTFDGVTDPETLLLKARAYLNECVAMPVTIELRAVDLGLVHVNVKKLKLGYWTNVESVPHGISKRFMLSKKITHLDDPGRDEVILGQVRATLTGKINKDKQQMTENIRRVASSTSREINRKVENATQLITGGKGGYVVLDVEDPDTGERALPWRILIMDAPEKDQARSVIQINKNGIGFSRTGINGPYNNAWTIDGNLVADFITTGTMLADRIRGGLYEVGGSGIGRDGKIVVRDVSDAEIGYWDKTGLHIKRGVIEGTDIRGGTINIGGGTFEVGSDGSVSISSGEINIGNTYISEGYSWLGDFGISGTGDGVFYSRDSGHSVEIHSSASRIDNGPVINLVKGDNRTRISYGSIITNEIFLTDSWWGGWSLTDEIKLLHNEVFNK